MSTLKRALVLAIVISASIGVNLASSASAATVTCGQTVTTSITLAEDLGPCHGNGLVITGSGITVDLGGHTIRGDGSPGTTPAQAGIVLDHVSNVQVRNGTVRDFDGGIGVYFTSNSAVFGMNVVFNIGSATSPFGEGIRFVNSNDNTVTRSTV